MGFSYTYNNLFCVNCDVIAKIKKAATMFGDCFFTPLVAGPRIELGTS